MGTAATWCLRQQNCQKEEEGSTAKQKHTYDFSQPWAPCIKYKHMGIKDFPTVYLELDVT